MINRQIKLCKLYEINKFYNKLGIENEEILYIADVEVAINFISINKRIENIKYKDCEYTGLTRYKGLNIAKEYKIIVDDTEYLIKSINENTRLSQWLLQEVIING